MRGIQGWLRWNDCLGRPIKRIQSGPCRRVGGRVFLFFLVWLLSCLFAAGARSQVWQGHQVTNFPNVQLRSVDSAIDSAANVHFFFTATNVPEEVWGAYYLRVSPQGDVLTDTVALREGYVPDIVPYYITAVGDGRNRVWGVWGDRQPGDPTRSAAFIAGRWSNGNEMIAPTVLGRAWPELVEAAYRPA
jgi:hypothetical protein